MKTLQQTQNESRLGVCASCGGILTDTLKASTFVMKMTAQHLGIRITSVAARAGERLLCNPCRAAGHSTLADDVVEQVAEYPDDWEAVED